MSKTKSKIYTGDSLVVIRKLPANTIDAIVTDPPYGISFNDLDWDKNVPDTKLWKEAIRVLKPGGHLLAFAGSRTYHQMASNIEKAGFEIRDQIMWLYGSGLPRSYNIALAIEKKYGAHRAKNWHGWGTTLKPAHEPIVVARKPFSGPVIDNVLTFGTGGLNVEKCRVESEEIKSKLKSKDGKVIRIKHKGRFPANVVHSDIDEPWTPYFYCAKPTTEERDRGLESFKSDSKQKQPYFNGGKTGHKGCTGASKNSHPTVKPIALMEHLISLVTPESGIVLDPFAGSGSTLIAAQNLNHPYIGIEKDAEYVKIAKARLAA